jgi:FtsP/CotA-like multicopper oxidase with cupredoxin domain
MRVRVTSRGIYGADGPIPVGTILTLDREPVHWGARYEVLTPEASPQAVPITNPAIDVSALQEAARGDARRKATRDARAQLEAMGEGWQ